MKINIAMFGANFHASFKIFVLKMNDMITPIFICSSEIVANIRARHFMYQSKAVSKCIHDSKNAL